MKGNFDRLEGVPQGKTGTPSGARRGTDDDLARLVSTLYDRLSAVADGA
jgi:hypothetical protein